MNTIFSGKEKQEAVGSEKSASFGASRASEKAPGKSENFDQPQMHFSAVKLFADRYPAYFADSNNERSLSESRTVLGTLIAITLAVIFAWVVWDERYFHSDSDLIYNMGLIGGILLLVTLLYSLRKRVRVLSKLGEVSTWYYIHLVAGVVGPVLIILHSSFTLKALNSTVALISMLCVIVSGIFGRYIYTRIGYSLHRQLIAIRDTEERLANSMHQYQGEETEKIEKALSALTILSVKTPNSLIKVPGRYFSLRAKAAACYVKSTVEITNMLKKRAVQEGWDRLTYHAELAREKRFLRDHINTLVRIGQSHFYERLLIGWRIFHLPLIFILVISGSVHVLAVHLY